MGFRKDREEADHAPRKRPPEGRGRAAERSRSWDSGQGPWRSRALIQSMFETMAEGVVLIAADDGRIVQANRAAERILGLKRHEIERRSYVAPEWELIDPEGNPLPVERTAGPTAMREKRPIRDELMGVKRRDGSVVWINVGATPLIGAGGEVLGVIGTFSDVTQRREAEMALRESESNLRSVLSSMDDLVFALDRNGVFISFYQPDYSPGLYRPPDQFLGKSIEENLPPDVAAPSREAFEAALATGEPQQLDCALELNGELHWYNVKVSVRAAGPGTPDGIIVVIRDISERKRAEEALEAAHATLERRVEERTRELHGLRKKAEQLAAMRERERLARELHDAVNQTLFSASLIADALPAVWERNPEKGRQRLDELRKMTRGALTEMRNLLLELRPAALVDAEPAELLGQLARSFESRSRLPVTVSLDERVNASAELKIALYRISQEALNNVMRHAGASRVSLTLRHQEECLELTIEDDGCGFDAQDVSMGSMGLAIMRERAEGVGALLTIDSRPGEGSRVVLVCEGCEEVSD